MMTHVSRTERLRKSETVCTYTVKNYTTVQTLGIPFIVIFTRKAANQPTKTVVASWPRTFGHPCYIILDNDCVDK
jgi:hypothetical protein